MSKMIRLTALMSVLLLCTSFSLKGAATVSKDIKPDTAAIEKAIKATYAEITKAAEAVDAEKLFSYVLDNEKGALISNGKLTLTRQQAADDFKTNSAGIAAVDYAMDRQYVTVISPETAVMVAEGRFDATTTDGRVFGTPMAQTVVFVLKDGGWKVLHSHTSMPAPR